MNSNYFTLKSTNASFSQRQQDVFDQLKILENNRKNVGTHNDLEMETDQPPKIKSQRSVTKHFRGKESIFKQPQDRPPKNFIKRIPDFKKNPHKWTKYSLGDVRDEDLSDTGNTRAALSFLKELKQRKSLEMQDTSDDISKKLLFNKPLFIAKPKDDEGSKPSFRSSKVVMPEYIIGQKIKKEKNRNRESIKQGNGKELKLDHLLENEDE